MNRHRSVVTFAANTDLGKTILSTALCRGASSLLKTPSAVAYIKPIQTGFPTDSDSRFVSSFCPGIRSNTLFTFTDPVSPHLAAVTERRQLADATVLQAIHAEMKASSDAMRSHRDAFILIETAGGVHSPTASRSLQSNLYKALGLASVLVGDSKLGGISTTLTAYESLRARDFNVPLILLFKNARYMNEDVIAENVDAEVVVVPEPPKRVDGLTAQQDREQLLEYFRELDDQMREVPFKVDIPQEKVDDLKRRLANARMPDPLTQDRDTREFGVSHAELTKLAKYWATDFDWRKQEQLLNRLPMFTATVQGHSMHFIHAVSPHARARPLILTHGWPGSFFEFQKIVEPLRNPEDSSMPAFHVIAPSIPGFGFSPNPTSVKLLTVQFVAKLFVELMAGLGYDKGGDWGSMITRAMAINHPKHCIAIHLNLAMAPLPDAWSYFPQRMLYKLNPLWILTPQELEGERFSNYFWTYETGYYKIQGTKPYTIGVGLNDSPIGLLAWIAEKFRFDGREPDPEELLTNISIYWFTQSITSSFRLYKDNYNEFKYSKKQFISVPTGVAVFKDISQPPEAWLKYYYNLQQFTRMPSGGHFAALDAPNLLLADIRKFFSRQNIRVAAKL
ncbi:hypothetical protein CcCBS67573_g03337 [Chytriomyces confervae]|uniref:Epoxide hydrolase N-terminal domain-containing protein n=1 Tax=Chytriomyces confervae TaxID=246404 RepID=A0A507FGB3_9FUNG|nr:hypothetical protein CcCBS67573_g03337 [Chytriomyces confervae]